jgi:hypothetical protein
LNALYAQRTGVGGFAAVDYWSSSQVGANFAWTQFFGAFGQGSASKLNAYRVRPVRAF